MPRLRVQVCVMQHATCGMQCVLSVAPRQLQYIIVVYLNTHTDGAQDPVQEAHKPRGPV